MLANVEMQVGVQWNDQSDLASGELVSGNYFDVLGVRPAMGRLLLPSDDVQNSNPVVVLSFNYWNAHFGGDPRVINQALYLNGHPFTIVGVAEPSFHSAIAGYTPKLFVPIVNRAIVMPGLNDLEDRRSAWANIVARLKPGVSREQAEAGMIAAVALGSRRRTVGNKEQDRPLRQAFRRRVEAAAAGRKPRVLAAARADTGAAADCDGDGGPGGADGVRQRVESPAGAGGVARAGDVDSLRHGSRPRADYSPVAGGRNAAGIAGRRSRAVVCAAGVVVSGAKDRRPLRHGAAFLLPCRPAHSSVQLRLGVPGERTVQSGAVFALSPSRPRELIEAAGHHRLQRSLCDFGASPSAYRLA